MSALLWLVPIALVMGTCGLAAFFWSMRSGQFEDTKGDASRILDDGDDKPIFSEDDA
ncbi:cbb3-type cytochrome oxidase assembly protein CcoS [Fretibacter rubidus]|uniref:cbb3-type cytochrome oxidase assembly protein CcoS n=1 Tax=Fretibacter rubidus TaxID=570162 RepID=UPI00352A7F02